MLARITVLQVLATIALTVLYYFNWSMKPTAFEVRVNSILLPFPIELVTMIGLVVSVIVCIVPNIWDKILSNWKSVFGFEYTRGRGLLILMIIIIVTALLMGPDEFLYMLVQLFIAFFFLAALLFGVYGIWRMKGTHIITSGMFTFFTALSVQRPNLPMWSVLGFAVCFLLFMELSSSAIRQYLLSSEELVPVKFQTRMVDRYLLYLGFFLVLAIGLTYMALRARIIINYVSPISSVGSLEVQGFVGLLLPALGTLIVVVLIRYAWDWRRDQELRALHKGKTTIEGKSPFAIARALLRNED